MYIIKINEYLIKLFQMDHFLPVTIFVALIRNPLKFKIICTINNRTIHNIYIFSNVRNTDMNFQGYQCIL